MVRKGLGALLIGGLSLVATDAAAGGWVEAHETSDDVRLEVGVDGVATVTHHLRYRIVAGRFKSFDIVGIDTHAEIVPEATFSPEKGGDETAGHLEPSTKTPGTFHLMVDDPKGKGLARGAYVVDVKYRLDLVANKMLTRDGAMWKLAWTAPPAPEGHDGARVVFDVPSAPTEPRLATAANEATTTLATLRRSGERDELELLRPHVTRGDAVVWSARVDPKAFPSVNTPELRPPPPVETAPPSIIAGSMARVIVAIGFAMLAGALALLLRAKQNTVRESADARNMRARPVLALPWGLSPFLYGVATTGALAALLWWKPIGGAALVVLALTLAAHRSPAPIVKPRGPGEWQPLKDPNLLLPTTTKPTDLFDLGAWPGRLACFLFVASVGAAAFFLRAKVPQIAIALPLAATSLLPLFVTGTRAQIPPAAIDLAAKLLRPARDAIASQIDLAHVELGTIGRVVSANAGSMAPAAVDEVRLAGTPRDKIPGLRAIELALATTPGGWGTCPEVLVRFEAESSAAKKLDVLASGTRVLRGRKTGENVLRLTPEEPTALSAAALVAKLLTSLEGKRASDRNETSKPPFRGRDRRRAPALALC